MWRPKPYLPARIPCQAAKQIPAADFPHWAPQMTFTKSTPRQTVGCVLIRCNCARRASGIQTTSLSALWPLGVDRRRLGRCIWPDKLDESVLTLIVAAKRFKASEWAEKSRIRNNMRAHFRAALPTDLGSGSTAARDPERTAHGWSHRRRGGRDAHCPVGASEAPIDKFVTGLRTAWQQGEVRSTSKPKAESRSAPTELREWFKADPHHG